ncbi:MAG TPA: hypothetical protein VGD23_10985, partial [Sphingomicrobium sp.]
IAGCADSSTNRSGGSIVTTQQTSLRNLDAVDATTDAAVAAGSSAGPGPEQNYRLTNAAQEA